MRSLACGFVVLLLCACPETGIVCRPGTIRCNNGCVDTTSDKRNCGGCELACLAGQQCTSSTCLCASGTALCDGQCVVFETDPRNCGACGQRCAAGEVCENKTCHGVIVIGDGGPNDAGSFCTGGNTQCGSSCVNLSSDPMNCGACGAACDVPMSCHAGKCSWDLVAACGTNGLVVGIETRGETNGPRKPLGPQPVALASYGETILSVDLTDRVLNQAKSSLDQLPASAPVGAGPNHILVEPPFIYVANSDGNTLQVLRVSDAGTADSGMLLLTIGELNFGMNTYPEAVARAGGSLWVPLYGGFFGAYDGGQTVVRVDVSDPTMPRERGRVSLSSIDLKSFDGGVTIPRPFFITAVGESMFVPLNNYDTSYSPSGPGMVARIEVDGGVSAIDLGADVCQNALYSVASGRKLFVSCGGKGVYSGPPDYALLSIERTAVVMIDVDTGAQASWVPQCFADAGLPDGGTSCTPILPGRLAAQNGRVYVTDGSGGRVFALDVTDAGLVERRGYFGTAGGPIQACLPGPNGFSNVNDIIALP
jgi:hypothetical protein